MILLRHFMVLIPENRPEDAVRKSEKVFSTDKESTMRLLWTIPWVLLSFVGVLPGLHAQPIVSVHPLTFYHTQPADVPVNLESGLHCSILSGTIILVWF